MFQKIRFPKFLTPNIKNDSNIVNFLKKHVHILSKRSIILNTDIFNKPKLSE